MRRRKMSPSSRAALLQETRPSTTVLCLGRNRMRKVAGALAIVLQQEGVDGRLVKELLQHRRVTAWPSNGRGSCRGRDGGRAAGGTIGGDTFEERNLGIAAGRRNAAL